MSNRTVTVTVEAEVNGFKRGMGDVEKTTRKTKDGLDQSSAAAERNAERMKKLGRASQVAGAAILAGVAYGLVKSTQAASDLGESVSKVNVVFGSSADAVISWAEDAATAMGMSKQQALEAAGTFGNLFTSMGMAQSEAAGMSQSVVQLAADLGSFNNVPIEDALLALRSGLTGEMEGLKKFGVNINEATLKAKALEMGLGDGKSALDANAKAQATYALVVDQSANAMGDFERTGDGLANSTKTMAAKFSDAQAALGESLLPAMTKAAEVASSLLSAFSGMPGPLRVITVGVVAAAGAFLFLAPKIAAAKVAMNDFGISGKAATKTAVLGTAKFLALAAAFTVLNSALEPTEQPVSELTKDLEEFGKTGEVAGSMARLLGDDFGNFTAEMSLLSSDMPWYIQTFNTLEKAVSSFGAQGGLKTSAEQVTQLDAALAQMDPAAAAAAFDRIRVAAEAKGVSLESLRELYPQYTAAAAASASEGSAPAAKAIESVAQAAAEAAGDVDEFAKKLEALIAPGLAASKAADAQKDALDQLGEAAKENGNALTGNSTKARANRDVMRDAIQANVDLATAIARNTGSVDKGKAAYDKSSAALVRAAVAAGYSKKEIDKLLDSMNATADKVVKPKIDADLTPLERKWRDAVKKLDHLNKQKPSPKVDAQTEQAKVRLSNIWNQLQAVNGKTFTATVDIQRILSAPVGGETPLGFKRKARGGPISGPGTGTSDSIPALLSDGEYVIRSSAVEHYGQDFFDNVNARRFAKGGRVFRKQSKYDAAMDRWRAAQDARNDAINSRDQMRHSTRSNLRSGSLSSFDFGGYDSARGSTASAIREQASAEDALYEARRRANTASRADKPAALRELAEAQRKFADAKQATADAEKAEAAAKPTAGNILANFRERVQKTQAFAGNLRTLKAWGLPGLLLSEIISSGLESGSEMAAALVAGGAGNMAAFQSLSNQNDFASLQIGEIDSSVASANIYDQTYDAVIPGSPGKPPKFKPKKKKKRRALGGNVSAGESYPVGEQGWEMFVPSTSGRILSQATMASGGGGNVTYSQPVQLVLDSGVVWKGIVDHNAARGFTLRTF